MKMTSATFVHTFEPIAFSALYGVTKAQWHTDYKPHLIKMGASSVSYHRTSGKLSFTTRADFAPRGLPNRIVEKVMELVDQHTGSKLTL